MIIDCNTCTARDFACHDCVISVLLNPLPNRHQELSEPESSALALLSSRGLVPPLRFGGNSQAI
ncbi:MAG: hypothetical protein F2846_02195 [Actinobacteria bacterium]|nr:hypothetical protein [Actinomycetota bacterium]MSW16082.1 hypothetical protein [Actinomycetota bacterium]MSZ00079.1 hypothetical protein [Actinomycetota bacterium]